ncbi:MAG: UTP--glucose-1-phosphate uridylyltransferase GalU [Nitrospirae bacterium]|nr:UTP--glucose-1-phosphate uridylyltransferase GalU [Nitrospirota bacterium]
MHKRVKKAVFPAGGLGTRFLPATKASPKEMLPIVDKPMIQYAIEEAITCNIEEFIIITGKYKRAIEDHFDSAYELEENLKKTDKKKLLEEITRLNHINFAYIRQKAALGLGHAILCARPFVDDEPFAVLLSDDVIEPEETLLLDMVGLYEKLGCSILALEEVPVTEIHKYGVIGGIASEDGIYKINDLIEKPTKEKAPSNLAIIGRYILTPEIFGILEKLTPGRGGEIQLTDALRELLKKQSIYGYIFKGKRYDAGDKFGYLKATINFALKNPEVSEPFTQYLQDIAQMLKNKRHNEDRKSVNYSIPLKDNII